jgi:hypothetical protein
LLAQIEGHTNLVYYDWELTGPRLQEWQILGGMIANRAAAQNGGAVDAVSTQRSWFSALAASAGNSLTEITRVAPGEFSISRNAPLAFTAAELALLSDWVCDAYSGPIHPAQPAAPAIPFPGKR